MADNNESSVFHVVAVEFAGQDRAAQVMDLVKKGQKAAGVKVQAWVVVEVDEKGKAHVKQTGHGAMGATLGAGGGLLLGLIGGPAGLLVWTLGSALLGGVAGKYFGRDFDPDAVKAVAAGMEPNSSAVLMVVEDELVEDVRDEFGAEADVFTFSVGSQLSGEFAGVEVIDLGAAGAAADDEE